MTMIEGVSPRIPINHLMCRPDYQQIWWWVSAQRVNSETCQDYREISDCRHDRPGNWHRSGRATCSTYSLCWLSISGRAGVEVFSLSRTVYWFMCKVKKTENSRVQLGSTACEDHRLPVMNWSSGHSATQSVGQTSHQARSPIEGHSVSGWQGMGGNTDGIPINNSIRLG